MEALAQRAPRDDFRHEALFYAGQDEFLRDTLSFVRDGLEAEEPTLVVLSAPKIEALRSRLNGDADQVHFADMDELGGNPARLIPAWRDFVSEHSGPDRRVRGVGEPICAARSAAELVECQRHESLLNLAFAEAPGFYLLCPYDTETLEPAVLEEARRSHPFLMANGVKRKGLEYRGLDELAALCSEPLSEPETQPDWRVFQVGTLAALRDFVAWHAALGDFSKRSIDELVLSAHEIASNSVLYGGGGGILRIWQEDDTLICEVEDRGFIDKPLAGRERPASGQAGGHGLWLANQLCDLVQLRTFAGGSVVRLHKRHG